MNDLGDPADAVANVSKALATTSGIGGAIGLTSATAATEVPILNSAKIPMVSQNGLSEFTTRFYPYLWRMTPPDRVGGASIGLAAARLGFKSAAVIIQNSTANTGIKPGIIAALKKKGVKVVTNLLISGDAASYDTVVNRIKNDKPGGLVISADMQTTLTLLSEYKSLNSGKVPPVVVPTGILETGFFHGVKKLMGESYLTRSLGMVGTFVDQSSPAFKQYAPAVKHTSIGATEAEAILATQAIGTIYDGIIVMSLAMDAAHSTTPAVYNKYMPKVTKARKDSVVVHSYAQGAKELKAGHQIQYVGVTGPVAFDKLHNSSGEFASFTYAANGSVKTGKILGPADTRSGSQGAWVRTSPSRPRERLFEKRLVTSTSIWRPMLAKCPVASKNWSMTANASTEQLFEVDMGEAQAPRPAAPAGEAKTFCRYDQNQCFLLLPPSLDEWLPEDHEAHLVSEVVENLLDLSPVYASYTSTPGAPPYHPRMMLKLLMFAYATVLRGPAPGRRLGALRRPRGCPAPGASAPSRLAHGRGPGLSRNGRRPSEDTEPGGRGERSEPAAKPAHRGGVPQRVLDNPASSRRTPSRRRGWRLLVQHRGDVMVHPFVLVPASRPTPGPVANGRPPGEGVAVIARLGRSPPRSVTGSPPPLDVVLPTRNSEEPNKAPQESRLTALRRSCDIPMAQELANPAP